MERVSTLLADLPPLDSPSTGIPLIVIGILVVGLAGLVFWVWMLVHAIKNPLLSSDGRLVWVLVIVLASWLGALIYFLAGRDGDAKGRRDYEEDMEDF